MKFTEHIKQLREERQMPQRQIAAALEIDTATYCKIEKGERRVRSEQVIIIANTLQIDKEELFALWIADQVPAEFSNEKIIVDKALHFVKQKLND